MQLVVQSGAEPGRTYDLAVANKIVLGRQSGNDVVVPDEQVSRKHAEVEERNGSLVVTDLGSSNGTFVNGARIGGPQYLKGGDTVQVGTTVLKVIDPNNPNAAYDAYGQNSYSQPAAQTGYGQPAQAAYGQQPQQAAYGQQPQQAAYGQQPQQAAYGQQPQQAAYGQPAYAAPPPTAYNQPGYQNYAQPVAAPAKKGGFPVIPMIIVGIIALLLVGGGGGFLLLNNANKAKTGDVPAPPRSTKLVVPTAELQKAFGSDLGDAKLDQLNFGFYTTKDNAQAVLQYYKDELKKKTWDEDTKRSDPDTLFFSRIKEKDVAVISAVILDTSVEVEAYVKIFPSLKGKIAAGDTLLFVAEGPQTAFGS